METFKNQKLDLDAIKAMDMVSYLSTLGYEPVKVDRDDHWYLSPLHEERTPSFKVNRAKNIWIDFGGSPQRSNARPGLRRSNFNGGNLVDFILQLRNWSISDLLTSFNQALSTPRPIIKHVRTETSKEIVPQIRILSERPLYSYALLAYLKERRIPVEIADRYCREVRYELHGKQFYAIGFKNNSQGFEIRNKHAKLSSMPKDSTFIDNGAKKVIVFEGFFNFLSFVSLHSDQEKSFNYVVLNSVSFFENARNFIEQHEQSLLYLDRDKTGQNYTQYALGLSPIYKDESDLYDGYKDLNNWVINFGNSQRHSHSIKL